LANTAEKIRKELRGSADRERAKLIQGFFRTAPGQYGEGDIFLGVTVPQSRKIAKSYFQQATLQIIKELLRSKIHEERMVALLMLVHRFESGEKDIAEFYIRNLKYVNNWDLVDTSAPYILGAHLAGGDTPLLYNLARSDNLWKKRVAIVSTHYFIRNNDFKDTLKIAEILLGDSHDLIHKATGWMLREVGKRDLATLEGFLAVHASKMPRTALRYAIERMTEKKRKFYLSQ
jgi:3-methyladenine DNA glycosylase AlkD